MAQFVGIGLEFMLVLKVSALHVRERRDTQTDHVRAGPQEVGINEASLRRILYRRVGATDGVAGVFQFGKCVAHPVALGFPGGYGSDRLSHHLHLLKDGGVVGDLHLVDGDTVRIELNGFAHAFAPVGGGLSDHAGNQVDIDLREADGAREAVRGSDFLRSMGAAVNLQDVVIEILNA